MLNKFMTTQSEPINGRATYFVTTHSDPYEMIRTQWGNIAYKHFLQLESDRWKDTIPSREGWCHIDGDGLVAMQSWAEYQKVVTEEAI